MILQLIAAGATKDEFVLAARLATEKMKGWQYALGVVAGKRKDAANAVAGIHRGPLPTKREPKPWDEAE